MKNQKLLRSGMVTVFAVLIILSGFLTGCPDSSGNIITVDSIFVKPPNQTAWFLADGKVKINLQGMVVSVNYSNGVTEKVIIDNNTTIIEIEQLGDTFDATFDGITVNFTVTSDGFTISYSGMELIVSGFDLSPGVKHITVRFGALYATFDFTIIGDGDDIAADIGYQKEPVFTEGNNVVKYPIKMEKYTIDQLALRWFDEGEHELEFKDRVGGISPGSQENNEELSITLTGSAIAGKYYFELVYNAPTGWIAISRRVELIISKIPELGYLFGDAGKLSAQWYETQAAANAGIVNCLIELTNDGKVVVPALNPTPTVGTWDVNVPSKCITITGIGSYALFDPAEITYEFQGTTKIHVQSSSPITVFLGLSEKDLFKAE